MDSGKWAVTVALFYHQLQILKLKDFYVYKLAKSMHKSSQKPASWSSGDGFVSGAGGLRFKSRAGQIGHSVANGLPPLRHFFERICVATRRWAPPTRYTLQCITASIMKDLI